MELCLFTRAVQAVQPVINVKVMNDKHIKNEFYILPIITVKTKVKYMIKVSEAIYWNDVEGLFH